MILRVYSGNMTLDALSNVSNTYIAIEESNKDLTQYVGEIRLYSNIMAMTSDEATFKGIATDAAGPVVDNIETSFAKLNELVQRKLNKYHMYAVYFSESAVQKSSA